MSGRRAWIYIRESKEELLHGYSPDEMVKHCRRKAEQLSADVVRVIVEEGKRDEIDCPGLQEMIDAARRGTLDLIISYDMMRLTGDLGKHIWFKGEIASTAAIVQYVTAEYAATPEGDLQEMIQGGFGRYERLKIRARTLNGITGKLERQQPICNGRTPYGYRKLYNDRRKPIGWEPDPSTARILQGIVRDLGTKTAQHICDDLTEAGVPTPGGKRRWTTGMLFSLLSNRAYEGVYRFGARKKTASRREDGKRIYRIEHRAPDDPAITTFAITPLVSLADLAAARTALRQRKKIRRPRYDDAVDPYSLRGRLTCGYGHGRLTCVPSNGIRYYVCGQAYGPRAPKERAQRCRLPSVPASGIEALAWEAFLAATRDAGAVERALRAAADPGGAGERHQRQVAAVRAELDRLSQRIINSTDVLREMGKGSLSWEHTKRGIQLDEQALEELHQSLAGLVAAVPVVMTEDDIVALLAAWKALARGIEAAETSASAQRAVYARLRLAGTVVLDPCGSMLGVKHRFGASWTWGGQLLRDAKDPCGILLLHTTHPDATSSLGVLAGSDPDALSWLSSRPVASSSRSA